ncbi:MurR/RpiR family transcriptional regulator [Lacrimispora amygdalina]|uniref:MurR/RpiR family transcriptional regulator n=1 Tax=Lacrimispora amygdalina TaxID=253257 RepID=A0A3E2N4F9_9FIRM|nr:MurR/RpiR family transcriptional regulator [Clostridium indicum]RFZ75866.1 MurR/RpiR family transcriptional regulator [Clostridium indicum]
MKGLLVRIDDYVQNSGEAEKQLISRLQRNPESVLRKTIKEIAKETYTSPATIVRLCKKLGCKGYKDFQSTLAYEVALFRESRDIAFQKITQKDTVEDIIYKVTKKNIESLETTRKLLEPKIITDCVKLLETSRTVSLFGLGTSLLVARDLYLKLLRADVICSLCDDWHAQFLTAKNLRAGDVAIVISYSGLTEEMLQCAKEAKANGAKVIAITRAVESKLAAEADFVLPVAATELIHRSGAMSSRISQLNVVDVLFTAYVNRNYEFCMNQFGRTHIQKDGGT